MTRFSGRETGFAHTRRSLLAGLAGTVLIAVAAVPGPAAAQQPTEVVLTAKHIEGFLASHKAVSALLDKIEAAGGEPNPKMLATLDALARKYGFKDFSEYEDVADTISIILGGIDPQTRQFTQPPDLLKKEIAQVQADKSLSPAERKELLADLNEQLKAAQYVKNKGNIDLVLKYYDKLEASLQ
jgi:hypothetical protein